MVKVFMTCKDCYFLGHCQFADNDEYPEGKLKCFKDKSFMVELPCKAGDKVYKLETLNGLPTGKIRTSKAIGYSISIVTEPYNIIGINLVGKSVFLTKEEAEKALKEREKNEL